MPAHDELMGIDVAPYNKDWPMQFARIRTDLFRALRNVPIVAIEHVGSTSVPGMVSKPVIDVDIVVDRRHVQPAIRDLEVAGYVHRGDLGIADRHAFRAPDDDLRRHVYVVVDGSLALRNHLAVRAALRADGRRAREYRELKLRLAREAADIDAYATGKTEFLTSVLAEAGFTEGELDAIRVANRPPDTSGTSRT
jgi:GrpB-like predicted nucleotidyltransferase (UPF0157 family)